MIILQILAGLLLIPFTLVVLLVFNIYVRPWVWQLGIALFGLFYAGAVGLLFLSWSVAFWAAVIFAVLYWLRISNMAFRLREKEAGTAYPIVKGDINIRHPDFRIAFVFPLSFLNVAKYTPGILNKKMSEGAGLEIDMEKLVPLLLVSGKGTEVNVNTENADIYFEIQ